MNTNKFKKGHNVYIKSVTHTSRAVGLDSKGVMRKMVGHHYPIKYIENSELIGIENPTPNSSFTFSWSWKDLEAPRQVKKLKPIIVNFDTKHLDV